MTTATNNSEESILDLMDRSRLAKEAGALTAAEYMELNSLANRLMFADDFNVPTFVLGHERNRFAQLKEKAYSDQSSNLRETKCKQSFRTDSFRSSQPAAV